MLGWNIFDKNFTRGGLFGYSSQNSIWKYESYSFCLDLNVNCITMSLKVPSSKGVSWGPNITAFQTMILFSPGAPLTPSGGSSWSLLKSRIKRLLAAVDILCQLHKESFGNNEMNHGSDELWVFFFSTFLTWQVTVHQLMGALWFDRFYLTSLIWRDFDQYVSKILDF